MDLFSWNASINFSYLLSHQSPSSDSSEGFHGEIGFARVSRKSTLWGKRPTRDPQLRGTGRCPGISFAFSTFPLVFCLCNTVYASRLWVDVIVGDFRTWSIPRDAFSSRENVVWLAGSWLFVPAYRSLQPDGGLSCCLDGESYFLVMPILPQWIGHD